MIAGVEGPTLGACLLDGSHSSFFDTADAMAHWHEWCSRR